MVGGTVVVSLAVAMAATLLVLGQVADGPGGAVLADETCERFDLASYEDLFGTAPDPDETAADGYSGTGTGNLTCTWRHSGADGAGIAVDAWASAESADQFWLDEKSWWTSHAGSVTDFPDAGESGFHYVQGGEDEPQKRQIMFVLGRFTVSVFCWIDPAAQSTGDADAFLEDLAEQADAIVADAA
ncbi:hypothetical protein [Glycomyces harbinensis]|uniref:DUF3558 domain-containing protein n=1 Tax=Glycomyces harbinensis TaxID=58114 RepID=A0A1G7DCR5_9ACTN|nr:hypothetical protein [Glycomyces harbinensis]SDE49394.1 hypothetical protein SAMN05216270_12431 [Glycomyces harbinensis]